MSLVVALCPQSRLALPPHVNPRRADPAAPALGRARSAARASAPAANTLWVRSADGLTISHEGRSPASLLPKADSVVAVLADADVAWHRLTLPKAPAARLRAALVGVLEDALLDEPDAVHLATAPHAARRPATWIAAVHKPWLKAELAALERAQVFVERVVPSAWPDEPATGHFAEADETGGTAGDIALTWSHADGVVTMRLKGTLARALLPAGAAGNARFSATPAAAAPAERWLGSPVVVMSAGARGVAVLALAVEPAPVRPRRHGAGHARPADAVAAPAQSRLAAGSHRLGGSVGGAVRRPQRMGLAAAAQPSTPSATKPWPCCAPPSRRYARCSMRRRRCNAKSMRCAPPPAGPARPTSSRCSQPPPWLGPKAAARWIPCASSPAASRCRPPAGAQNRSSSSAARCSAAAGKSTRRTAASSSAVRGAGSAS